MKLHSFAPPQLTEPAPKQILDPNPKIPTDSVLKAVMISLLTNLNIDKPLPLIYCIMGHAFLFKIQFHNLF